MSFVGVIVMRAVQDFFHSDFDAPNTASQRVASSVRSELNAGAFALQCDVLRVFERHSALKSSVNRVGSEGIAVSVVALGKPRVVERQLAQTLHGSSAVDGRRETQRTEGVGQRATVQHVTV